MRGSVNVLNAKASRQALPTGLSSELRVLLTWSTHRIDKARDVALGYLNRLIRSFPSLMCTRHWYLRSRRFSLFCARRVRTSTTMRCRCCSRDLGPIAMPTHPFLELISFSLIQCMSSIQREWISHSGSSTTTRFATRSWPYC